MSNPEVDPAAPHHLLDATVRDLAATYGEVTATGGKAGIAFIIVSDPEAVAALSRYIQRRKRIA